MTSASLKKIDLRLEELDPQSLRYQVLAALRRFRASWVELGRLLVEAAYGNDWKGWGYESFEDYYTRELNLKSPTVKKLMVSYNYMRKNEPERLAAAEDYDGEGPPPALPDYQTVELLHRADECAELGSKDKERFHTLAFNDGAEEAVLRKELRQAIASHTEEDDVPPEKARQKEMADLRRTCMVLRKKLADSRIIPEGLRERFERLLQEFEALE